MGADFTPQTLRYERMVLLMDPDADGIHCGALMLMFFLKHLPQLLETGRILMVRAPVGEVIDTATGEIQYGFIDTEFAALCQAARQASASPFNAQRYRGLAGIAPSTLAHFCINPLTRRASVMAVADAQMARAVFAGAIARHAAVR